MKADLNKLRQSKEYQGSSAETDLLYTRPAVPKGAQYQGIANIHNTDESKPKDIAGDEFMLKQAKDLIVNNLQDQFYDIIFQAVADEMSKNYMFRQNNYLTEAGEELFEDAWHEWYREQHSDILYRVLQTLEP